jgi:hypothetical protein
MALPPYQYPVGRVGRRRRAQPGIEFEKPEQEKIGLINGQTPDSKEEWWVAKALWQLNLDFLYQFNLFGGRGVRGGQVLDFLVFTQPLSTALQIFGQYWHSGQMGSEDKFKLALLEDYFAGQATVEVLWAADLIDMDTTLVKVRELLL